MSHYTEDEDGVTLHFKSDEPPVRAQVLIGADGYFSKVRAQCLRDGPPTFNVRHAAQNASLTVQVTFCDAYDAKPLL